MVPKPMITPVVPDWETAKKTLEKGIDTVAPPVAKSADTVFSGWKKSVTDIFKDEPKPPPGKEPSTAQEIIKTVRKAEALGKAVLGAVGMGKDIIDLSFAKISVPLADSFETAFKEHIGELEAATITCMHTGLHAHNHPPSLMGVPPVPVPLPSIGPIMLGTCWRVLINNLPAARAGDIGYAPTCGGFFPYFQIKTGSSNTFIGGNRAARRGDITIACGKGSKREDTPAGKVLAKVGQAAEVVSDRLDRAGKRLAKLGVALDVAEAVVEDDPAMKQAKAISAAAQSVQMAVDKAAKAAEELLGKDPGIPAMMPAFIVTGHSNVLIGGFPMINIPNPVDMLLNKLKRFKAKAPSDSDEGGVGGGSCPVG